MIRNSKHIAGKGFHYVITRRIIQRHDSTVLRVRVSCFKGVLAPLSTDQPVWTDHRDFTSIAEGDQAYAKQIAKITSHVSHRETAS